MILPLSIFGVHTIRSDLNILGNLFVYNSVTALDFTNRYGVMSINDMSSDVIAIQKTNGIADLKIKHDDTLQISEGRLSVVPKILMQSDLEMKAQLPLQLAFDSDNAPEDPIGSTMKLLIDPSDFQIDDDDGHLQLVPEKFKGIGAIQIQTSEDADWSDFLLEDLDISIPKLRAFKLKTSDFFSQDGGTLSVANKPGGQIPFYSTQGGIDSDNTLTFDGASTLSVRFVKIDTSLQLQPEYAVSKHYVSQYIQSSEGSAIDVLDETSQIEVRPFDFPSKSEQ
jgi:hypothetical protein